MIQVYSTPSCPRCRQLEKWLAASGKAYMVNDMSSAKIIAELRTEGQFSLEAPILRKQAPGKDEWFLASDLFQGDMLDESKLAGIIGGDGQ